MKKQSKENVIKVYKKYNPSILSSGFNKAFFEKRKKIVIDYLKIPKQNFKGKEILDLACGTGEIALCYALLGAKLYCVDANPFAITQTKKLFAKYGLSKNLIKTKVSYLENIKIKKKFDIVNLEGILHHTSDPNLILKKITNFLKKDSILIVGFLSDYGAFQKILQKIIIKQISKTDDEIFENVKKLFSEGLKRATYHGRPEKNIIADAFINPIVKTISIKNILKFGQKKNLSYYSSFPSIESDKIINISNKDFFSFSEAVKHKKFSYFFPKLLDHILTNSEKDQRNDNILLERNFLKIEKKWNLFLSKLKIRNYSNQKTKLNNFIKESKNLEIQTLKYLRYLNEKKIEKYSTFFKELKTIFQLKDHKKFNFKKLKSLFKGSEGTPFNYLVFYKK